ncbi:hypothetical protein [Achromobacter sp. GD03932]|uniref:hypothetical protein n=1 Tax=Achromobacter sp. GD03932 TaxID=2975407 RepID=UPI00244ADD4B|nr:hypothetical protein [Achromobacter sp. GD03932]MDH1301057.1 hypothetical protein [Achromobacter sp. GD03932]
MNAAPASIEAPRSYAQWSACLDRLSEGLHDEACLDAMRAGDLNASGGVVTLFSRRLADEFNARLTRCSEHLTRDLRVGGEESLIVRAILNARKHLAFLHRLAQVEIFPATLRTHLIDELRKFAQRAQQSLEDSAKTDRSGRLLVLLRNNPLVRYESAVAGVPAAGATAQPPISQTGARRRNIIL